MASERLSYEKTIEVESINDIHKIDYEDNKFRIYAKINGQENNTWILTFDNNSITVNGYFWTEEVKQKMEEFIGKKIDNPSQDW